MKGVTVSTVDGNIRYHSLTPDASRIFRQMQALPTMTEFRPKAFGLHGMCHDAARRITAS